MTTYPTRVLDAQTIPYVTFEAPEGDWAYVSARTVLDAAHTAARCNVLHARGMAAEWLQAWCRAWPIPTVEDVLEYTDTVYAGYTRETRAAAAQALLEALLDAATGLYPVR